MRRKNSWRTEEEVERLVWAIPVAAVGLLSVLYAIGVNLYWWS